MKLIAMWLLACLGVAFAQEMTPEADKAYQAYLFEKQEADNVYKDALNKAKEKCVKVLKKEQDALLVKKDLAGANKIQAKIDELTPEIVVEKPNTNTINDLERLLISNNWRYYWEGKDGQNVAMKFGRNGQITSGKNRSNSTYKIVDNTLIFINAEKGIEHKLILNKDGDFESSGDLSDCAWKSHGILIKERGK